MPKQKNLNSPVIDEAPPTKEEQIDIDEKKAKEATDELMKLDKGELEKQRDLVNRGKRMFNQAKEARRKHDWEWLVRNLYLRGYHFARYNRGTNTVTFATRTGVRIPINLTWAHLRSVRNQVVSFKPKWEVMPGVTTESAIENARYSEKLLDYFYKRLQVKRKLKEVVTDGLVTSIGVWELGVDKDSMPFINTTDTYDLYVDPGCRTANLSDQEYGAEYVIKTVAMPIERLKNNKRYHYTDQISADNEPASAEYKRFLLQVLRNQYSQDNQEVPTVTLYELWMREYQDDGDYKLRVVTFVDSSDLPLRNELTDETQYPFEVFQGNVSNMSLYSEAWIKHIIPINRVVDALESHVFEYNHFFAKGRFVIDRNSGVRIMVNQHGQIIEKNRGSQVTSLPIAPLPSTPFQQLENFQRYLEDISGAHDVSLGRVPGSVRSGTGIAELRQADATNQDDLIDNLEDFLERVGTRLLSLVADNWDTARLISITGLGGKPDYFMTVGERSKRLSKKRSYVFGEMELPLAVIGKDNEVNVRVGSWLAYTKSARKDELKELYRIGAIDQKALLEHLEFGDVSGILARTRKERLLEMRAGRPAASVERMTGQQISDEELALSENSLMLEGKDQPVEPDDDHEIHIELHRDILDDKDYGDIVRAHINEHVALHKWLSLANSKPLQPGEEPPANGQAQPGGASPGGGMPGGGGMPPMQ